jgi:hypothetical protein
VEPWISTKTAVLVCWLLDLKRKTSTIFKEGASMDWYFIANSITLIAVFVSVFFLGRAYEIMHQLKKDTKEWSKK